jgi:hypothetical protein
MKVFLSWSGNVSHKVAIVLRDWLPSVIQSIEPYVSSEDIDKGARWSTDIAKELEDSTFGILCVTKDNLKAPWLTFEAGALSKTMDKAFVCPFLFDIKRSEVDGPILQFQSTILEKADIKKLIKSLNKACAENKLSDARINKAFNVWYPNLENELGKIKIKEKKEEKVEKISDFSNQILEEILELTRINQKLLRNPDKSIINYQYDMSEKLNKLLNNVTNLQKINESKNDKYPSIRINQLIELSHNGDVGIMLVLSICKKYIPWIYDLGIESLRQIRTAKNKQDKINAAKRFEEGINLSEYTRLNKFPISSDTEYMMFNEIPKIILQGLRSLV